MVRPVFIICNISIDVYIRLLVSIKIFIAQIFFCLF